MATEEGITIFDPPIEVDLGQWTGEHPGCDSFITDNNNPTKLTVIAVSTQRKYNSNLNSLRNRYVGRILKGLVPQEGSIIV